MNKMQTVDLKFKPIESDPLQWLRNLYAYFFNVLSLLLCRTKCANLYLKRTWSVGIEKQLFHITSYDLSAAITPKVLWTKAPWLISGSGVGLPREPEICTNSQHCGGNERASWHMAEFVFNFGFSFFVPWQWCKGWGGRRWLGIPDREMCLFFKCW